MVALAATSNELRKYPMVTENLTAFAGPQCYPHLDPKSVEYRVHANRRLKTEAREEGDESATQGSHVDAVQKRQASEAAVFQERCWMKCDRCGKHRCVAEACLPVLRGFDFFEPAVTDLDWESWLRSAGDRYSAVERAQGFVGVGGRRRLRRKSSEVDAVGASVVTEGSGAASRVCRRLTRKTSTVDEEGSDASAQGLRSASDHECASDAGDDGRDACAAAAEVVVDRREQRCERDYDVGLLVDRLSSEKAQQARLFLEVEQAGQRFQISQAEKRALFDGWVRRVQRLDQEQVGRRLRADVAAALVAEREPDGEHVRLAWTLLELKRRACKLRRNFVLEEKELLLEKRRLKSELEMLRMRRDELIREVEADFVSMQEEVDIDMEVVLRELAAVTGSLEREQRSTRTALESRKKQLESRRKKILKDKRERLAVVVVDVDKRRKEVDLELAATERKLKEYEVVDEEIEEEFFKVAPRPRLQFECSMLQTAVEDAAGVVSWRDVRCDEEDDLTAL